MNSFDFGPTLAILMTKMFLELSSDMKGQNPERYPCIILHLVKTLFLQIPIGLTLSIGSSRFRA